MGVVAAAVTGAVVSGGIAAVSASKASKAASSAANQASAEQAQAIADAEEAARIREEELQAERQRIFDATKPMQESAQFTFGLGTRPDMGGFSDFIATGGNEIGGTRSLDLSSSTLLGGLK